MFTTTGLIVVGILVLVALGYGVVTLVVAFTHKDPPGIHGDRGGPN